MKMTRSPISFIPTQVDFIIFLLLILQPCLTSFAQDWLQWGGPEGNFKIESQGLAMKWPVKGPRLLWKRPLGEGYSSILHKDGRLYTMTSDGTKEIIISMDAQTGETVWEHRYTRNFWSDMRMGFGPGPNASPLIVDDCIIAVGIAGDLRCLNIESGKLLWKRSLTAEFGRRSRMEEYGYSASPLKYKEFVIVQVGGDDHAVIALNPKDGSDLWRSAPGGVSYAQPSIIHLAGEDQYIYFSPQGVNGLDPTTGELLWHHIIPVDNGNHLTPVVLCDDHHLFVSSQFNSGGGRLLKITAGKNKMNVEELWFKSELQASCWTNVRVGDFIYGSTGGHNFSTLAAFEWRTGRIAWQHRGHRMAQCLHADNKLLYLDEKGNLLIARFSPLKLEILNAARVSSRVSWTLPTLVGATCFIRDRENILALDLAKGQ